MKKIAAAFLVLASRCSYAQTPPADMVPEANTRYIYNPQTRSVNLSFDFSNLWDFDGDKQNDSLVFIGNGGAHAYFYPRIILSTYGRAIEFTSVQIDMPCVATADMLSTWKKNPGVQFVVHDFDHNGICDLYLNFNNPFSVVPKKWKARGVSSKYVVLYFSGKQMRAVDYP